MDKELNKAIKYLKLIRKNHDLEKKGYVYTEECIETVLNYIQNSIPKEQYEKLKEQNEEYSKQLDLDYVIKNYIPKKKAQEKLDDINKVLDEENKKYGKSVAYMQLLCARNQIKELLEE